MNYRPLLDSELERFKKELPDYTLGQTLFAILTSAGRKTLNKADLLKITDEELYKHVNIALRIERED